MKTTKAHRLSPIDPAQRGTSSIVQRRRQCRVFVLECGGQRPRWRRYDEAPQWPDPLQGFTSSSGPG